MTDPARQRGNFGGIDDPQYGQFDKSRILVFPVAYENTVSNRTGTVYGAAAIIDASRGMELYDVETDSEVYRLGIHTLDLFAPPEKPEKMTRDVYGRTKKLLETGKFICLLGGDHSISVPVIRAHAEKFHNLSVLQIDAYADLRDPDKDRPHSHDSVMTGVVREMKIPSVQIGVRSISAEEARLVAEGLPTKVYRAMDIAGRTDWIDGALDYLTENVYLTIDIKGLDPSLVPATGKPEPGGLGWYETLALIKKLAAKKRVVGMDLVEYAPVENQTAPAFLCARLVYKSLAYIFRQETPKVVGTG